MADKTTTNWADFTPVGVAPQTPPPSAAPSTGVNWDDFKPAGETGGTASDLGKSLKVGAQRLPGMVTGLADLPFALAAGARPVTKAADALGEATGFQPGKWADETKFSPAYNEGKANIDKAWKDGSAGDIALSYLQNPAYTANQVVESVPSMVAGGLAGRALMGVGRVAAPLAKAGGVGPAAPGLLARTVGEKLAAPLAGGIGEGAVTAGQQMQQYQGDDQQKNAAAALGAGVGTAALGFGAGRVANKMGLETAETAIINAGRDGAVRAADNVPMSAKRRILSGMVSEGVLQELPQSVQEQMWQNYAEGKPLTEGIARAGVEGALAGAVMGAGANVSDGGANKRAKQQTIAERLAAEAEAANALTTSPGAADPNAPERQAATPPEAPDLQTSLGAGVPRNGMDFTREVDTSGLSLQDPAEVERARAATMDYQPGDATPQWETSLGAAAERQGLNMPPPEFDTGSLGIDTRPLSERMGINPSNGALSKAAAMAVDTGVAQEAQFLGATGRELQPRRTGPGVTNESNVIDVQGRVIEDRAIATPRRLTEQRDGMAARALGDSLANQPSRTSSAVPALGGPVGDDRARGPATAIPDGSSNGGRSGGRPATGPGNPESGAAQPGGRGNSNPALTKGVPNTQTSTPSTAPRSQSVPAARPGAVEAAGVERSKLLASLDQPGATREMVLDARLKDAQYRLGQAIASPNINRADQEAEVRGLNQEIADLTNVRDQARELDERDRREGSTRFMLQGARQELDAAVRAGAVTSEAAQAIASKAQKTGNAADAAEVVFAAVDSSTEGATSEPQATQAVQASPQPAQTAAATPAAEPAPGIAGAPAPVGTPEVRALTDGPAPTNPGAQSPPAPGAQGAAPSAAPAAGDRPKNWRTSMLGAKPVAKALGIDAKGKRLAQVVAEIDARDTQAPTEPAPVPATVSGPVRIGRDNTPMSDGGKPFKTRKAAGDAKKLQPMMRVVTVPGGYALAEKTPAQLAAEERASRRLRNPNTSAPGAPIPAHAFIAAAGGLNRAAAADMGVDGNPRIGNRTLLAGQGRGLSLDQATQMLIQDGYLSEGASINDALALIKTSLTRPQYNADGIERIAEAEVQAQFEDYLAAQEEAAAEGDADPFGMANEFTAEELDDVGYTDADPALQAEVAALITQAEAIGIDTFAILEDIARTYADATQDQYNAAARDTLAQAIARGNQNGGSTAAQAAPAAEPAADQGLDPTPALELASQTPAEAAAQQEAQAQAAKAEAARQRAADAQAARDEERKRIAQASVRAADRFELGQDPLDSLTGQGSIFDAPDQPQQAPAATEPVAQPITRADVENAQQQARADNRKKVRQGAAEASPIEDAGEKIGGARKDRWKERGLNLDDLDAMTEAEGAELATKANVWKPDYEALSEASEPVTAALVKTIYDQLAAKPKKNTPEGRRQYVQMMRIVRDVYTEAKGPEAVKNAYLEIRKRAGLNAADPAAKSAGRELLFSVYKGRSDPFVLGYTEMSKAKKLVEDGFPAKAAPWKSRLSISRMDGGPGTTERGIDIYMERSAEVGTPLTREQILDGFYRVNTKDSKTVAFAPTKADAEAAAATVYERDMKGKKDGKPEPVRPNLDELKRENMPRRIDRDVAADDFVKDLGFRGIEFGNWSAQDERQRILNMAYDGLMDLAEIMGVPPKAMSLNGTLGMAFGARGGGRFAAHYEPGKLVINMTKIRGGGSMAHEWAHAMDHYFGELDKADAYTTQARGASGWYSEDQYNGVPRKRMERVGNEWKNVEKMRLDNLRPEMAAAFDEVMRALFQKQITKAEMVRSQELDLERTEALARNEQDADMRAMYANMAENKRQALEELRKDPDDKMYAGRGRTDYANQAQALSGKSENGYWTRPTEMFARAFESWVFDRVTAMGARSDYLVHGVEEDRFAGGAYKGTVSRWLAQVRSMLRQVWNKIAGQKGDFNSLDLVNLAFGIAQRENPAHVTELDAATAERAQNAEDALKQISDQEDLFTQPKSNATTIQEIVAEHDPEIKVRTTDLGGETMYTLTMPDGTRATITSREPTKDEVFGMDPNTGGWISERPGEKAPPKGTRSDVWVDVSALKPGQNGARVYNIASTFAHNTGRIFIGDPSGLSDMALRRRAEQMLSSALKFGTTDHIAPHPRQVTGDAALGVPPLRWVYGDHAGNIERLIDVNQQALENAFPEAKNLQYDLDTGNFIDARTGETVDPVRFDAGRERGVPARDGAGLVAGADGRGTDGVLGAPGAGWRTVARGAVFRALLREGDSSGTGPGDQRGAGPGTGRSEVVDGPVRQRDQPDSLTDRNIQGGGSLLDGLAAQRSRLAADNPKRRIFYSRAATAVAADYTPVQQAAAEKAFGAITKQTLAERAQAFRANMGTKLRQGLVDQFAPIKEVSQQAYMLARMSKGSDGAVEAALLYGKPFLRDGVTDVNMQDGGFANVLASLKGEHDRFFQWVAAQRAERLKAEGKENLLTNTDIAALRSLNAGKMADGTVRMPLYAKALQELNAFNEASLKVALESGLIDQAAYDLMRDQPYVPFYRLMEEGDMRGPRFSSGLTNQQAWKKLKGGTQQLNADLLQNTLLNWSHLYAAAARNRAALATMTEAENLGIAYQVPADTKGSTKVMRDGVAEHWMVEDPYLLEAISALNYTPGGIAKALAPFKRLLTFGVTVNPTFKIRNLIRDSLSAIAQSDLSYNPAENVAKGWKATSKGSQTYASMLASGGIIKFGTQENTNHLRGQIERLGGTMLDKQGWEKFTGQMRSLWETYEEFGDRTENVNRAALYERLRAKGLSHAEASFQARDLMDFSMSGKWEAVRFLTQTVPFLNARLQGLYKLGRAAKEDPRRFAAMAGAVSMASLALLAAYSDDEDWKKREDWDRDNFWWFKVGEMAFRIPKPFEVGAIGTVAERTAELMLSDEMTGKRFGQRISDMVFNTFAMDPTPQAIKPFLDVYANKDSFSGRAIEGMADERLRPQDRYNERTSEVARLLGSWGLPDPVRLAKGEYAGLSPKQIDFLMRGYFGWLATVSTTATDAIAKPLLGRGERPEARLRDAFLAGNFVESLPSGSSRYVTAMYEQARDVEQAWASYQAAIKSGDIEKAREIQQEEAPKLRSRMAVENAKSQIADLNARAKRIESDKFMSAQAKRAKLDEIEALRNRVAERVAVRN